MEEKEGYVDHIVYRNEGNGYTVFELECEDEIIACVGSFHALTEGEHIRIKGEEVLNPTYGPQYQIQEYEIHPPEDTKSIQRYLASGAVKGVGAALADRIIRHFKEDTFRIVEEEPERLAEVKGISEKKAREIAGQISGKRELRLVMMQLQEYGISYALSMRLFEQYGLQIGTIIRENPYRLAEEVQGIGFQIADEIAKKAGIGGQSDFRVRCGIFYTLQRAGLNGHMYLPKSVLLSQAEQLLGVGEETLERHLIDLCIDKKVYIKEMKEEQRVYSSQNYFMELNVARMLLDLNVSTQVDEAEVAHKITKLEERDEIELDEMQRVAVSEAVQHGLLVITGGPGTGKTTTIQTIIHYFESEGMDLYLAAPTGRAAKRMTETTGYEAQTIHRLLELSGALENENRQIEFGRNEENPLEVDVIIIDETSMVDMYLMNSLLKAVLVGTRLIFVGDVNQLPSVGPGSVLKDMIDCGCLPVVRLTKIFRQAMESDIVRNAHKINAGEKVVLDSRNSHDFFFIEQDQVVVIQRAVLSLVQTKLPRYVHAEPSDIQVLTPMRKGALGVTALNQILQKYLNPPDPSKKERETKEGLFRVGDKVMQIRNNYQLGWEIVNRYNIVEESGLGVFNGDVGIIRSIDDVLEQMVVVFDDNRQVVYSYRQLEELELAYAITVHKAQGSEYPAIVMPVFHGPRPLMNRNLLYTAVTRAKNCVAMVGSTESFYEMIENESENRRYCGLKDFLEQM